MRRTFFVAIVLVGGLIAFASHQIGSHRVGDVTPSGTIIPVGEPIQPVGKTVSETHRPSEISLFPDGSAAAVLDESGVAIYDLPSLELRQRLIIHGSASMAGVAVSPDQKWIAVSDTDAGVHVAEIKNQGVSWSKTISLPKEKVSGSPYPCGLTWTADSKSLLVCASRANRLIQLDLASGSVVHDFAVDPAPFSVTLVDSNTAFVSCWSQSAKPGAETADASGTQVPVDSRGIVSGAAVDKIDLNTGKFDSIPVERQPANLDFDGKSLIVPCANGDSLEFIDQSGQTHKFDLSSKFGRVCSPTWAAKSENRNELAVTLGRADRLAIYDASSSTLKLKKTIKTAWYPSCVVPCKAGWLVACAEGYGSRSASPKLNKHNVYDYEGTLSLVPYDTKDSHTPPIEPDPAPRNNVAAVPVPERMGEPSVFRHVIYVLKENRTYDQILGDMTQADGSAALCDYPKLVTPNQHKIAETFALLDNYYCNGILSADGHAWAMEGNATSYFEKTFGGWTRSYPYGDDPLSVSSTGFIWNDVIAHHRSFTNYGEFDYASVKSGARFQAVYADYTSGKNQIEFNQKIGVKSLIPYTRKGYPGWNLEIPDVVRARIFLEDIQKGKLSDFTILYLPEDHTSGDAQGEPTPKAYVADNDLAVGKVIEGISHSKFWKDTVLFVNEDDPQAGYDHVDGHRSTCLVVSPYTVRAQVISRFYNQTSVLRTIERILGIPPMNRVDATSPLMTACFTSKPDMTPFDAVPNQIPLDEMNHAAGHKLSFSKPDLNDDRLMNGILWKANHPGIPYPKLAHQAEALFDRGLAATVTKRDGDD